MAEEAIGPRLQLGQPAPRFTLPAVGRDGAVRLADILERGPLLLALMRGIQCPFCRRNLAVLGATQRKLRTIGADILAVVATTPERARAYHQRGLVSIPLAADPEMATHRSYGVPCYPVTPDLRTQLSVVRVDPFSELAEPVPLLTTDGTEIHDVFDRIDGFIPTTTDQHDRTRQFRTALQSCAQFLIDRDGIVRWSHIEGEPGGLASVGRFPKDADILAAVRELR